MTSEDKVYMLNALWFKPDGAPAYDEYARAAGPIVARLGGRRVDAYRPVDALIGDWRPDLFFIVEWPSWRAFTTLAADPDYLKIAQLRERGLARSLLIRCQRLP